MIDKILEGRVEVKSLFIACIVLELVDAVGKAFGFY